MKAVWTEQRERVYLDRYALKDQAGNCIETRPEETFDRVATALSKDSGEYASYLDALTSFRFVPAGRVLAGAGAEQTVTLYNCFVLGVKPDDPQYGRDSRQAIMDTTKHMIEITSRGGGVGLNWGVLRPNGSYIRGVNGQSTGSVAWMSGADAMVDKIRQGGSRTAALMYILPSWHPDVIQFADSSFLRANHSVAVDTSFMEAVRKDAFYDLIFPDTTHAAYNTEWDGDIEGWQQKGLPVISHGSLPAREMMKRFCEAAVRTGNPGLVFLDRANDIANTGYFEQLIATNPCGEQILPAGGCCNLGAINLPAHYSDGGLRWDRLSQTVHAAVGMMDRVIDISPDINNEIGDLQRRVRRIGLGTMGLADILIEEKLRYGSAMALKFIRDVYDFIMLQAYQASVELAKLRGPAPAYAQGFLNGKFVQRLPHGLQREIRSHGIRNLTLTNQAPTGTTSILAGVSSGIEPIFSSSYVRQDATGKTLIRDSRFRERADHLVTAHDLDVENHLMVQATVQHYMDNSISKTINLPAGSTPWQVEQAYTRAWDLGCKGITVYVDGSRDSVLTPEENRGEGRLSCGDECELPLAV